MKNVTTNTNVMVIGNTSKGHHYWVGQTLDGIDHFAGQSFKSSKKGTLRKISIFPEMIIGKTDALLSVFEFDEAGHLWNEKKAECTLMLDNSQANQWVSFDLENMQMDNSKQYAFKLSCKEGGMMAVAECPWTSKDPYPDGEQWTGSSINPEGSFHRSFDLSFVAEIA